MAEEEKDRLAPFRGKLRKSFWMMGLAPIEAGDVLSTENHSRVYELLSEDGMTLHTVDARGAESLLLSVAEEQLAAFEGGEWRVAQHREGPELTLILEVGHEDALGCPFEYDLSDGQALQEAIALTDSTEINLYGVTHFEEGLMLTIRGTVELPDDFRQELRDDLLLFLNQPQS